MSEEGIKNNKQVQSDKVVDVMLVALRKMQELQDSLDESKKQQRALEKQIVKDKDSISTLLKLAKSQSNEIEKQQERIDKQEENIENQKNDLKEQRLDLIQYFGIFVAIFTAISIDVQLLKFAQNVWQISGLMLIVNTAPLFLFFLIRWIYKGNLEKKDFFLFMTSFTLIFACGFFFLYIGDDWKPETVIERTEISTKEHVESIENVKESLKINTQEESVDIGNNVE